MSTNVSMLVIEQERNQWRLQLDWLWIIIYPC